MDRNRHMATRTAHPSDNVNQVAAPVGLLVDFSTDLGPNCQPLSKVGAGMTVTATVDIRFLADARGGRARGIITGSGGQAIITVDSDSYARLRSVLTQDAKAMVRGTVTLVNGFPTISVWAAQAVSA